MTFQHPIVITALDEHDVDGDHLGGVIFNLDTLPHHFASCVGQLDRVLELLTP